MHYLVFCHGADSHEDDDNGIQLNTEEWLQCAEIFCAWVIQTEELLGHPIPVSLSLFGGYRSDDFDSVLSLHTASLMKILNILANGTLQYAPKVRFNSDKMR